MSHLSTACIIEKWKGVHTLNRPGPRDYSKSEVIDDFATLHPRQHGLSNWSPAGVDYAKWQIRGRRIYFWPGAEKSSQLAPSQFLYSCPRIATQRYKLSYFQILIFLTRFTSALLKITPWSCPAKSDLQRWEKLKRFLQSTMSDKKSLP